MKAEVGPWRGRRTLRAALGGWLAHARAKQTGQLRWRAGVRHAYRSSLRRALEAWRSCAEAARLEQRLRAAAQAHYEGRLQALALQVGAPMAVTAV
jgi:hypothetical protein